MEPCAQGSIERYNLTGRIVAISGKEDMATNTGKGYRKGAVKDRCQTYNPKNDTLVKRDSSTGKFMDAKKGAPFKGVPKYTDDRRK